MGVLAASMLTGCQPKPDETTPVTPEVKTDQTPKTPSAVIKTDSPATTEPSKTDPPKTDVPKTDVPKSK